MNEFFLTSTVMPNQKKASGISYTVKVVKLLSFSWVTDIMEFSRKKVTKNVLRTIAPDVHLCSTKITTVVKSKLAIIFFVKNALTSIHSWHRRSTQELRKEANRIRPL